MSLVTIFPAAKGFGPGPVTPYPETLWLTTGPSAYLRPQVPLYAGAFAAGMLYISWFPGKHNTWRSGGLSMLSRAGIGSGNNLVSEFVLDILHKFGIKE